MAFKEDLYEVVKGAVPRELCIFIDTEIELLKKVNYLASNIDENNVNYFADGQCKNSFPYYGSFCTETLGQYLQPKIEEVTEKTLYPTYSYMRIYYTGSDMERHTDRPSCEYSATVCISNNPEPWEIWFENLQGEHKAIYLEPGDMIVYKGDILPHWRTEYKGTRQTQIFVHFVNAEGKYRDYKFDRRPYLAFPSNTRHNM
jgi:hypothetical protein